MEDVRFGFHLPTYQITHLLNCRHLLIYQFTHLPIAVIYQLTKLPIYSIAVIYSFTNLLIYLLPSSTHLPICRQALPWGMSEVSRSINWCAGAGESFC